MKRYYILALILLLPLCLFGRGKFEPAKLTLLSNRKSIKIKRKERFYQEIWCNYNQGIMEYRLKDKTRVDCLTSTHAIEFDFARKWAESIGQSLYYAKETQKKAGIVLILKPKTINKPSPDNKYLNRLKETIIHYRLPIDLCTSDNNQLTNCNFKIDRELK